MKRSSNRGSKRAALSNCKARARATATRPSCAWLHRPSLVAHLPCPCSIPLKDRFQIFHEKKPTELQIDKEMWDVQRTDDVVVFHIFTSPRTAEMKLALYERLPQILADKGMRPEDVFISVSSNQREDWSFGNGRCLLYTSPSPRDS